MNSGYSLWMLVEHDGEVLIDGEKTAQWLSFDEFLSPRLGDEVAKGPVGIGWIDQAGCSCNKFLVHPVQGFSTDITEGTRKNSYKL